MADEEQTVREAVLKTAIELTTGDRNKSYGDPKENHWNIAEFWRVYLDIRRKNGNMSKAKIETAEMLIAVLDAEDVMMMMALMKIARIAQRRGNTFDSVVDACAYLAMTQETW